MMHIRKTFFVIALAVMAYTNTAYAIVGDVGVGVVGGLAYSPTDRDLPNLRDINNNTIGSSAAWGFLIDIPLLETFYLMPSVMLYELDLGYGKKPVTDLDLCFKFVVPLPIIHIGVGFLAGMTNLKEQYNGHYGLLGSVGINVIANLDLLYLFEYKQILRNAGNISTVNNYLGIMFHL